MSLVLGAAVSPSPQLFYAFTLGMLAAVNPCGFPLLPAYLDLFTTAGESNGAVSRAGRALSAGAFSTLGVVALFGALGIVIELGWSAIAGHAATVSAYLMACGGIAMAAYGVAWLLRHPFRLSLPELRPGLGLRRPAALAVFGFSYGVASIGCALPLFVSGVATTFVHADLARGIEAFVSYALGMGAVFGSLAVVVALLGPAAVRPLRRLSRFVPVLGGSLLVLVGTYLSWYWVNAIVSPTHSFLLERWVTAVQQDIAAFVNAHSEVVGSLLGALVVAVVLSGGLSVRRRSGRSSDAAPPALRHEPALGKLEVGGPAAGEVPVGELTVGEVEARPTVAGPKVVRESPPQPARSSP
ncbi:MAG: cytochrome c biogenesis CcdA family protein [Acidimicrobiales bacterium]